MYIAKCERKVKKGKSKSKSDFTQIANTMAILLSLLDNREKGLLIPYMETIVILCSLPHLRCFWISRFQIGIRLLYQYLNYSCPSTCSSYSIRTNGTNCSRSGRGRCCLCCLIRPSFTNIQESYLVYITLWCKKFAPNWSL